MKRKCLKGVKKKMIMCVNSPYTDGGVADVDGVVRVRRMDVELQDVMNIGRVD